MSAADAIQDDDLERAALCALLRGARADDLDLPPEAFAGTLTRAVYEAILLSLHRMRVADTSAVASTLRAQGQEQAAELVEMAAIGTGEPANIQNYAEGLRDLHARRSAIRAMETGIAAMADRKTRVEAIAHETTVAIGALSSDSGEGLGGDDVRSLKADWYEAIECYEDPGRRKRAFVPVPYPGLTDGDGPMRGFPCRKGASTLSFIVARSGAGKTADLATLLHHWICDLGLKCGLVGLEDGTRWLIERWIARDFCLDWGSIGDDLPTMDNLSHAQVPWIGAKWSKTVPDAPDCPPLIDIGGLADGYEEILDARLRRFRGSGITSARLAALIRKWISEGVQVVVVDHGLLVEYLQGKNERLDLAIKRGLDGLNRIGLETGVPIIQAWHLNRAAGDDEKPPAMKDIKESGYLDANATLIRTIWRDSNGRTLSGVIKSRKSGGLGRVIELSWAGKSGMFRPRDCVAVDLRAEKEKGRGNYGASEHEN